MSIRLTGMVSGLDTDSLVKELVNVQKMRNKRVEDKKVTLEWTKDIWKTLNSKIYTFYREQVSKVRLQGSYQNKKVSSSNDMAVEARAESNAPIGTHKIKVKQLASSQYLTSGRIEKDKTDANIDVANSTKISDLIDLDQVKSAKINIGDKEISIDSETTIGNIIDTAKEAGLNANFDSVQKRFFISSKDSGQDNAFQISETIEKAEGVEERVSILDALKLDTIEIDKNGIVAREDSQPSLSSLVEAQDSIVIYNGARLRSDSNTLSANGLTFTLISANPDEEIEEISITVANDSQATYDMIKDFIKGYNEILGEMNTRYNANTARGYDPLTEEQKETMSEKTIEKWENTIKDSLLRRDSTLSTLISSFKTVMGTQVQVDGKNYSLSSFGIVTGDYTERGLLHINGDKDDPTHATEEDKLLKAIEEDPELVSKVFSEIGKNLYDTMTKQMSSIPNVRSAFTFYNDKLMDKQVTRYEREVADLEKKLYELEEKYYNQFAKMETALSKMQSQSTYLYSMMGMN